MTRDYGHFHNPVSALQDLHPSGETRPSHDHVVDVACCRGCVWKHEESRLGADPKDRGRVYAEAEFVVDRGDRLPSNHDLQRGVAF